MANNCGSLLASGLGACNSRIQNIAGLIISTKGTTYTSAELDTITKTKGYLAADTGIVSIFLPLSGFTITTDEPTVNTSSLGIKGVFDNQIPSATAYLDRSFHDYRHLWDSNNTIVDVELITKENYRLMTSSTNGVYKGFRAEIYSAPGLPKTDNPNEAHPLYLFFKDVTEFQNMQILSMPFTRIDIEDVVPIGCDIRATSAYSSGDVNVKVSLRGGDVGKTGFTTWNVIDSNVDDPGVTTDVDNGAGSYTLTVQKDVSGTPADLVAGNWVKIQGVIEVTNFVTYITNVIKIGL